MESKGSRDVEITGEQNFSSKGIGNELEPDMGSKTWAEQEAEEDSVREKMEEEEENRRRRIKMKQSCEEVNEVVEVPLEAVITFNTTDDAKCLGHDKVLNNGWNVVEIEEIENEYGSEEVVNGERRNTNNPIANLDELRPEDGNLNSTIPQNKEAIEIDFELEKKDEEPCLNYEKEAMKDDDKIAEDLMENYEIPEAVKKDDEVGEAMKKDDEISEPRKKDDKISEARKKDDEVSEAKKKDGEITETKYIDDKKSEAAKNDKCETMKKTDEIAAEQISSNEDINDLKETRDKVCSPKPAKSKEYDKFHRTGLANLGNTCYMNSILQTLMCTEILIKELYSIPTNVALGLRGMSRELLSLTMVMKSGEYRLISPRKFRKELTSANPIFGSRQQQDAHEALSCMLDTMANEIKKVQDRKIVENIFDGKMNMKRQCLNCGSRSIKSDPFRYLQVEVPKNISTVTECVANFMKEQIIGDKICENCGCSGAKESASIAELPNVLIVQLKRFRQEGQWQHKIYTRVKPDHFLDMEQYVESEPEITDHGKSSYQLYSIIDHHGGLSSGHYTAQCQDFDEKWIQYDDAVSRSKTNKDVTLDKLAYILFYKKVNPATVKNSVKTSGDDEFARETTGENMAQHTPTEETSDDISTSFQGMDEACDGQASKKEKTGTEVDQLRRSRRTTKPTAKAKDNEKCKKNLNESSKDETNARENEEKGEYGKTTLALNADKSLIEEDEKLYCVCQKKYNQEEHECMVRCDRCEEWFHCDCIKKFSCDGCCEKDADVMEHLKNTIKQMKEQSKRDREELDSLNQKGGDAQKYRERLKLAEKENVKVKSELKRIKEKSNKEKEELQLKLNKYEEKLKEIEITNTEASSITDKEIEEDVNEQDDDGNDDVMENDVEKMKKELGKYKRQVKKLEKDSENLKREVNQEKNENLQHTRTIRNLNDHLDNLKRTCHDIEIIKQADKKQPKANNQRDEQQSEGDREGKAEAKYGGTRSKMDERDCPNEQNQAREIQNCIDVIQIDDNDEEDIEQSGDLSQEKTAEVFKKSKMQLSKTKECDSNEENSVNVKKQSEMTSIDRKNEKKEKRNSDRDKGKANTETKRYDHVGYGDNKNKPWQRRTQDKSEEKTCLYFLEGRCRYGVRCNDLHPGYESERTERLKARYDRECIYYRKGFCRFKNECYYIHRDPRSNDMENIRDVKNVKKAVHNNDDGTKTTSVSMEQHKCEQD